MGKVVCLIYDAETSHFSSRVCDDIDHSVTPQKYTYVPLGEMCIFYETPVDICNATIFPLEFDGTILLNNTIFFIPSSSGRDHHENHHHTTTCVEKFIRDALSSIPHANNNTDVRETMSPLQNSLPGTAVPFLEEMGGVVDELESGGEESSSDEDSHEHEHEPENENENEQHEFI